MRERFSLVAALVVALGLAVVLTADNRSFADDDGNEPEFSDPTDIDNKYLPLAKFDRCELAGEDEGAEIRVVRTRLDRTETFSSTATRCASP